MQLCLKSRQIPSNGIMLNFFLLIFLFFNYNFFHTYITMIYVAAFHYFFVSMNTHLFYSANYFFRLFESLPTAHALALVFVIISQYARFGSGYLPRSSRVSSFAKRIVPWHSPVTRWVSTPKPAFRGAPRRQEKRSGQVEHAKMRKARLNAPGEKRQKASKVTSTS